MAGQQVFISYNSREAALMAPVVAALQSRLAGQGIAVWIDQEQILPGQPWLPTLEAALAACTAAVVLVGPHGLGPVQQQEVGVALGQARQAGKPVIPVRLPEASALPAFLGQYSDVHLPADLHGPAFERAIDRLVTGIIGQPPQSKPTQSKPTQSKPTESETSAPATAQDLAVAKQHFASVDPQPIEAALAACVGLVARIAARAATRPRVPALPDARAQAEWIAQQIEAARLDDLANLVDPPLEETIAQGATGSELDALARLLRVLVQACTARDIGLVPGQGVRHVGESRAWAFRAMIDHSCGLDGMRLVRLAPGTVEARLDDGLDSTRAVRSGQVTQRSIAARVHELVCAFADVLGTVDQDRPAPADDPALTRFCETVNNELSRHNHRDSHVLGLWDQCTCEPDEVKDRLLRLLPNLRLCECADPTRPNSVLRVQTGTLETWYSAHLRTIEARREALAAAPPTRTTPHQPDPPASPVNATQAPINVNVNIAAGASQANQATDKAQAHQHNLTAAPADLLPLLQQLLDATQTAQPHYAEVRKTCREAQGEIEETKALSVPTRTRLQQAIAALPTADKALGVATKIADLVGRLAVLGA